MGKPNTTPPFSTTAGSLLSAKETGLAVGATPDGMVLIARVVNGVEQWGEVWYPDEAVSIAKMLREEAAKAKAMAKKGGAL